RSRDHRWGQRLLVGGPAGTDLAPPLLLRAHRYGWCDPLPQRARFPRAATGAQTSRRTLLLPVRPPGGPLRAAGMDRRANLLSRVPRSLRERRSDERSGVEATVG